MTGFLGWGVDYLYLKSGFSSTSSCIKHAHYDEPGQEKCRPWYCFCDSPLLKENHHGLLSGNGYCSLDQSTFFVCCDFGELHVQLSELVPKSLYMSCSNSRIYREMWSIHSKKCSFTMLCLLKIWPMIQRNFLRWRRFKDFNEFVWCVHESQLMKIYSMLTGVVVLKIQF